MMRSPIAHAVAFICLGLFLLPAAAAAQSQILGVVTDPSGAVLPGVTVEAASPALIEKVRTAVTDTDGRFAIVDLRPGTYAVTFTLPGFSPLVRDGMTLPSNFTATVNAELTVGSIQETVTVSGQAPVVDVQSTQRTTVVERELLDSLPTGRTFQAVGALVVGIRVSEPNVGGARSATNQRLVAYGSVAKDTTIAIDGMKANAIADGGDDQADHNEAMTAEVTVQTSGLSAEVARGGPHVNLIPREGGNRFSGTTYVGYTDGTWQSDNLGELLNRGLAMPDSVDVLYYANASFGGPIKRDKLWFYGGYGDAGNNNIVADSFYPDGRPGIYDQRVTNTTLRLTSQITARNRLTAHGDYARKSLGHDYIAGVDVATSSTIRPPIRKYTASAKWTSTVSNNFLFEAGFFAVENAQARRYQPGIRKTRGTPEWHATASRVDLVRGTIATSPSIPERMERSPTQLLSSSVSYVAGSHTLKTGVQWGFGFFRQEQFGSNGDLTQRYRDGIPDSVIVYNTPTLAQNQLHADLGFYVQDSWRLTDRLTVSPGIRFEYLNASIDAGSAPAGRFVPAREFAAQSDLPNWFDVAPRLGVVYDLTGDARTALKGTINKYNRNFTTDLARLYDPLFLQQETRNWSDCDYVAGTSRCSALALPTNGDNIAQDNEIGPSNNRAFGAAPNRHFDPDSRRPYDLEYTLGVEREVITGVSVAATWFRRESYNFQQTINRLVDLSDYSSFQVTNPFTGEPMPIYNLNPAKQGLVDLLDTTADRSQARYSFNGFEVTFKARLPYGGSMFGGWSAGKAINVTCANLSDPNTLYNCDHSQLGIPYRHSVKMAGSFPLPYGLTLGTSMVSNAGSLLGSNVPDPTLPVMWAVPANLFPGGRTQAVTMRLDTPGTRYLERWNQLDLNLRRTFRAGSLRLDPGVDVYNVFNTNPVLTENQNFGSSLGRPLKVLQGRLMRLTAQISF
jgi:carboxypeptidase family protein/TonB-dependent receptor-like protein